jgi:hypothetical protein
MVVSAAAGVVGMSDSAAAPSSGNAFAASRSKGLSLVSQARGKRSVDRLGAGARQVASDLVEPEPGWVVHEPDGRVGGKSAPELGNAS